MAYTLAPLERLSEQLERLPGIGRRSAARLAFHLLYMKQADADALTEALRTARESIHECPICCDLTDGEICPICADQKRDPAAICVVAGPQDVMAIDTSPAALAQKLVHSTSGKCWLHHPKAETFLSERLALLQRVYK